MTPSEFKSWFDGFTEALTGTPTKAQWARIKERVAEIDGKPTTERIYVDRYWPTYIPYRTVPTWPYWTTTCGAVTAGNVTLSAVGQNYAVSNNAVNLAAFDGNDAMHALGVYDAQNIQ